MLLTTRCPRCAATFEVAPDQLRIRGGLVRCGECAAVFDGNACLVDDASGSERDAVMVDPVAPVFNAAPAFSPPEPFVPADATEPPAVLRVRTGRVAPSLSHDAENGWDDRGDRDDRKDQKDRKDRDDQDKQADQSDGQGDLHADVHDDVHDDMYDDAYDDAAPDIPVIIAEPHPYARAVPEFMDERAGVRRQWARRLWGLAVLIAVLVLTAQALVVFRVAAATAAPMLRPALDALCQPLGCVVGYERRAERLSVTASSLQPAHAQVVAVDEDVPAELVLSLTLRNRYPHPQPWPALMLDLRDYSDTVVVRRALLPGEYLPETVAAQPIGAGVEITLSIPLTVTGMRISGYHANTFYP